jgi:hypothetical protein
LALVRVVLAGGRVRPAGALLAGGGERAVAVLMRGGGGLASGLGGGELLGCGLGTGMDTPVRHFLLPGYLVAQQASMVS